MKRLCDKCCDVLHILFDFVEHTESLRSTSRFFSFVLYQYLVRHCGSVDQLISMSTQQTKRIEWCFHQNALDIHRLADGISGRNINSLSMSNVGACDHPGPTRAYSQLCTLQQLHLDGNRKRACFNTVAAILSCFPNVTTATLHLSHTIGWENADNRGPFLGLHPLVLPVRISHLSLDLSNNPLGARGCEAVIALVAPVVKQLHTLRLCLRAVAHLHLIESLPLRKLSELIGSNRQLYSLRIDISFNGLTRLDFYSLEDLMTPTLRTLHLSIAAAECEAGTVQRLVKHIAQLKGLKELKLDLSYTRWSPAIRKLGLMQIRLSLVLVGVVFPSFRAYNECRRVLKCLQTGRCLSLDVIFEHPRFQPCLGTI